LTAFGAADRRSASEENKIGSPEPIIFFRLLPAHDPLAKRFPRARIMR